MAACYNASVPPPPPIELASFTHSAYSQAVLISILLILHRHQMLRTHLELFCDDRFPFRLIYSLEVYMFIEMRIQ